MIMRADMQVRRPVSELRIRADRAVKGMAALLDRHRARAYEKAYHRCPVDTGFMREHIVADRVTEPFHGFEVGWREQQFLSEGLPFYPVFLEFGTSRMSPRPTLGSTAREVFPQMEKEMAALLRQSFTRG